MKTINRDDISEEVYWDWLCANCNEMTDVFDESDFKETVVCEHCHEVFRVIGT